MDVLNLIGRNSPLFKDDIANNENYLKSTIKNSSFLVIGGAGTIGQAVTKEIFKRNPRKLHVVDISENNLVELVRDLRSSVGYTSGEFKTFALDVNSFYYKALIEADGKYDYVLNLSALKHVRSEKDPYTLMRMIEVNILNTLATIKHSKKNETQKYFCVSTDKAANPVNMMGASKRIMELFLMRESKEINISTARFANVAFSDGSLLHGFNQRIQKKQPIVAPNDIKRYFVTPQESGELCLLSTLLGDNKDIFFPKLSSELNLITFAEIAVKYLDMMGYQTHECSSEEEARSLIHSLPNEKKWPCLFTKSDTTGEKDFEEFYTDGEVLDLKRFESVGIVKSSLNYDEKHLEEFLAKIQKYTSSLAWTKEQLVNDFQELLPELNHKETGKYLDSKM